MFKALLLLVTLAQTPNAKPVELGIIAGTISPSHESKVILLTPQYAALWTSDVQKRLDMYWERYKPAFAAKKEFFFEVSKMAQRDSLDFVLSRMQHDPRLQSSSFIKNTGSDGKFEFKDVPVGEYKVIALTKSGADEDLLQESVEVTGSVPQFVRLKKDTP